MIVRDEYRYAGCFCVGLGFYGWLLPAGEFVSVEYLSGRYGLGRIPSSSSNLVVLSVTLDAAAMSLVCAPGLA